MIKRPIENRWRRLITGLILLPACGCALMRKDVSPLPEIQAERIRVAGTQDGPAGEWPRSRWWLRYQDDQLDELVTRAIQDAPAMAVARQRVKTSQARAGLVKASTGAMVGLTGTVDREEVSKNGFLGPFYNNIPPAGFTGPWYTEGTVGLEGGYTFDPWGRDRAMVQAALGAHRAQQAELAETELVLSTWVVQTYYQYQAARATLAVLERTRSLLDECSAGHRARVQRGLEERGSGPGPQAGNGRTDQGSPPADPAPARATALSGRRRP
jgi:multidrug efflux system outer membrane protein